MKNGYPSSIACVVAWTDTFKNPTKCLWLGSSNFFLSSSTLCRHINISSTVTLSIKYPYHSLFYYGIFSIKNIQTHTIGQVYMF